jgi:hypothetical protein
MKFYENISTNKAVVLPNAEYHTATKLKVPIFEVMQPPTVRDPKKA